MTDLSFCKIRIYGVFSLYSNFLFCSTSQPVKYILCFIFSRLLTFILCFSTVIKSYVFCLWVVSKCWKIVNSICVFLVAQGFIKLKWLTNIKKKKDLIFPARQGKSSYHFGIDLGNLWCRDIDIFSILEVKVVTWN